MSTDPQDSSDKPAATGTDVRSLGLIGWLSSLPSRFGMGGSQTLRDTLETALRDDAKTQSAFSAEERGMLLRLLRFGASRVDDIMVPRADIIAAEESAPIRDLIRLFEDAGVSRVPVFHETLDDPRGMIHIKDLFRWLSAEASGRPFVEQKLRKEGRPDKGDLSDTGKAVPDVIKPDLNKLDLSRPIAVAKIRRPVLYVPPSMPAMNLLIRMQTTRNHMALVVDEYGGTDGLVTIEDLVEQIVGDIEDEHDEAEAAHIATDPKLGLVASGRTPVSELETHMSVKLLKPDEEAEIDTLGGLMLALVGRVPARGEVVRHPSGVEFEILDADARRVKKLRIHVPKPREEPTKTPPASPAG